jgi:hypothetical protein
MKLKNYARAVAVLFALNACVKAPKPATRPVEFTETTYETLGTWDAAGRPNYLAGKDNISPQLLSFIGTTLPEGKDLTKSHPELFTNAIADIKVTQPSEIYVTFVTQSAGQTDVLGFYTYPTNTPPASAAEIKKITYIFPNVGANTQLQAGDKVKLGNFNVGTSIGFVLMQNGWSPNTNTINTKSVHFCSNDALNPETDPKLKKHAVLINYASENKVIIGFEDLDRTKADCDHDFNDAILYATVQ